MSPGELTNVEGAAMAKLVDTPSCNGPGHRQAACSCTAATGYTHEYPISHDVAWTARVTRIYGGTTEIMKEVIGRKL